MKILERLQKSGSFKTWRHVVNFWTILFFAAIIYDFLNNNALSQNEILLAIAAIFVLRGINKRSKEMA